MLGFANAVPLFEPCCDCMPGMCLMQCGLGHWMLVGGGYANGFAFSALVLFGLCCMHI
jgi:hypothetical protein